MENGIHIILDLFDCQCDNKYLTNDQYIKKWIINKVFQSGLKALNSTFHSFGKNQGYTGFVCLAESHVSIHTWPNEIFNSHRNITNVDIYVCNYKNNNEAKAEFLKQQILDLFEPKTLKMQKVYR